MSDTTTIRPRDEHGRFIAASDGNITPTGPSAELVADIVDAEIVEDDQPSAELATIWRPYGPPFWQERAWNLAGRAEDEVYTLIALQHGLEVALEGQVATLEQDEAWAKIPNRGFLMRVAEFHFDADISNRATGLLVTA